MVSTTSLSLSRGSCRWCSFNLLLVMFIAWEERTREITEGIFSRFFHSLFNSLKSFFYKKVSNLLTETMKFLLKFTFVIQRCYFSLNFLHSSTTSHFPRHCSSWLLKIFQLNWINIGIDLFHPPFFTSHNDGEKWFNKILSSTLERKKVNFVSFRRKY